MTKKRDTPVNSIAVGFWDAFGEWTPNTPRIMAEVAIKALERDGFRIIKDDSMPHKFPKDAPGDVLAWICQACGEGVSEFGNKKKTKCKIDWRRGKEK